MNGHQRDRTERQFTRRGFIKASGAAATVAGTTLLLPHGATVAANFQAQQTPKNGGALIVWPSITIALTILSFNVLGDSLLDLLDPRLRHR